MSSFTGVSIITDGEQCTTTAVNAGTDSGYHLLVVKGYSHTIQQIPNGLCITTEPFMVGGHRWYIEYYPNGVEQSCADFISLCLVLCCGRDDVGPEEAVKVHFLCSFVDMVEYQKLMRIRAVTEQQSLTSETPASVFSEFMKRDALERSTYMKDDCFTIRCDIIVCKDSNTQDVGGTMSDIGENLDCLLQNKLGADVTFEVSGEIFAAHRCVLAARSTVFMAQLFGPMKEGTTSSSIQIKDMEPKLFRAFLSFIYTGTFPDIYYTGAFPDMVEEGKEAESVEYVVWLQALFVAADRYDLQRLKLLCEEELSEHIGVSSVASTLVLAEQHHCHGLKEACLKFIQGQSIPCLEKVMATDDWELIISTCPSVLKEIIVMIASSQKDKKRKRQTM